MNIQAFIIHLKRAEQRRSQVDRIIAGCPVKAQVIDAVDGRTMSELEQSRFYRFEKLFEPRYPFRIGPGEIGCFLSHRKAWQKIVDDGLDAGLIIEDDVEIDTPVFGRVFDLASRHVGKLGYVQFQVRTVTGTATTVATGNDCRLVAPVIVPLRTSAQLVSRSAASRLLEKTGTFDRPVDGMLQLKWETGLDVVCAVPSGVSDRTAESGGSTISNRRRQGVASNIRREILRWRYRLEISRLSRRHAGREQSVFGSVGID